MPKSLKPYEVKVEFKKQSTGMPALERVVTPRLILVPVLLSTNLQDNVQIFKDYFDLFTNPITMKSFSQGMPWEEKYIESIVESYSDEWKKGYLSSGFSVFNKKGQFIGNVTIEKAEGIEPPKKGEVAELYYLFKPEYWGQGYATEAVSAVMNSYLPIAINRGYKFDNIPLRELFATVRIDNLYSKKLLDNIGLSTTSIISKFGAERYYCNTYAKQIVNRYYHYYQLKNKTSVERLLNQNFEESDITLDEMVASAFGRASNTAKKARGISY